MIHSTLSTSLESKYEGERAFIIGNGPSLNQTPLEKLDSEYTFGVNKINKMYSNTTWRPSFFFAGLPPSSALFPPVKSPSNPITHHVNNKYTCFLPHQAIDYYGEQDNIYYYTKFWLGEDSNPFHKMTSENIENISISHLLEYWSMDVSNLIYIYHSLYGLTQLVIWMGFDEIYFIGTDLGLEYKNPHMICDHGIDPYRFDGSKKEFINKAIGSNVLLPSILNAITMKSINNNYINNMLQKFISIPDSSHFDSTYFGDLRIMDGPQLNRELTKSHTAIKRIAEYIGVDIYNATFGGELKVYPRKDIDTILSD
jgi:hypothetical protein